MTSKPLQSIRFIYAIVATIVLGLLMWAIDHSIYYSPQLIEKVLPGSPLQRPYFLAAIKSDNQIWVLVNHRSPILVYRETTVATANGNQWDESPPSIAISQSGKYMLTCQDNGLFLRDMHTGTVDLLILQTSPITRSQIAISPSFNPEIRGVYGMVHPQFITDHLAVVEFSLAEGSYSGLVKLDSSPNQLIGLDGNIAVGSSDGTTIAVGDSNVHWTPELSHWIRLPLIARKHVIGSVEHKKNWTTAMMAISTDGNWIAESEFNTQPSRFALSIAHRLWDAPIRKPFPRIQSMAFYKQSLWVLTESEGTTVLLKVNPETLVATTIAVISIPNSSWNFRPSQTGELDGEQVEQGTGRKRWIRFDCAHSQIAIYALSDWYPRFTTLLGWVNEWPGKSQVVYDRSKIPME